jgi:hypothetical protein
MSWPPPRGLKGVIFYSMFREMPKTKQLVSKTISVASLIGPSGYSVPLDPVAPSSSSATETLLNMTFVPVLGGVILLTEQVVTVQNISNIRTLKYQMKVDVAASLSTWQVNPVPLSILPTISECITAGIAVNADVLSTDPRTRVVMRIDNLGVLTLSVHKNNSSPEVLYISGQLIIT